MTADPLIFYHLAIALGIGLLIGVERGWQHRAAPDGQRVAGVRTYGLLGLLGGCSALLAEQLGAMVVGLMFIGVAGALTAIYSANLRESHGEDVSITSLVAGLLVFVFGLMATGGMQEAAVAAGVVTMALLTYKPQLHRWVHALEESEVRAGTQLLLISAVILPILPHQGYGPWQALNPYELWWMVVLIATISFVGYFALKLGGARKGALLTGLLGGLVSSTALTLNFSRLAHQKQALAPLLATGILLACGTMLPRILLVASVLNPSMFASLWLPLTLMAVLTYVPALVYWFVMRHQQGADPQVMLQNPLELRTAILFGGLLAVIMLLGKAFQDWVGAAGVLLLAAASGVADVDAITLSLARMSLNGNGLALPTAVFGIVLATAVNSLVKAGIVLSIGGWEIGWRVGMPLLLAAVMGISVAWYQWLATG
ncbi:MgtC/SapB family protein [Thiothrix fructosivorans]|uniref:MgtC/SapB family protein n=1 Tax=Thiothrix fructosivorans TaxID=111770 RepID=A0A8B0SJN2_9GAMM|nr:MgtC/SapB family protein [Thiothrix fructosivorans]MBO0613005.1 MgtC/SapB family protein [Thiothrix fructosivorans]QTX11546.1 MgtC/SapB family protein [Thiothrix fructosivorans]